MGTTTDKLNHLIATKEAIKKAIVAKGVSVANTDTFRSYASKIAAIPQEGGGTTTQPSAGDVTFRDYDGTILHAYSKDEFLALTAMPSLPTQPRLTCQGWNYTLEDAQAYVEEYGTIEVGATYITDDGKTRLYITIAADGRMDVPLYIWQSVANGVTIDWGDGSPTETLSGVADVNTTHHYDEIGDYVITLEVADGCKLRLGHNVSGYAVMGSAFVYRNMLQKVEVGERVTSTGIYVFNGCYSLSSIVIPSSVTSIGEYAFNNCFSLSSAVIPSSVTSIGNGAFNGCYSLSSIVIPSSVTSIGASAFYGCCSLSSVVIPSSVTSIGTDMFKNCYSLSSVVIPSSVTRIGATAFYYCYSLSSVVIPSSVTSIGVSAFYYCFSLSSVVIPSSVTSIGTDMFISCYSLSSVVIPSSVTSIGASAFYGCEGIAYYDFTRLTSIPTLGTNTFTGLASDCKIIVPYQLYSDWVVATNWSTYAAYIIMNYTPEECLSLEITVDEVPYGNFDTAKIHWTAVTNGVMLDGTRVENVTLTGSNEVNIGLNKTSESVTKEVSYTYMGVTATTTVTQGSYLENCIICKYNATSTTSATTLMYSSFSNYSTYFSSMIVDGVETTIARTHTFSTLGEHTVIFKVADGVSITTPYRMFYNCTALTYADCTELDLSAATSTSTSSGTAQMFYGCTNLKRIILPDTVKYLGYYMFYGCANVTSLTIKASTAPTVSGSSTWGNSSACLGYYNRSNGTNKFYVPIGATGYDASNWARLYSTSYCGFTKEEVENL